MKEINDLAPNWRYRRVVVFGSVIFFAVIIGVLVGLATWTALVGSFGLYYAIFAITTELLAFAALVMVIGSYVFGSAFQSNKFLDFVKEVAPDLKKEE